MEGTTIYPNQVQWFFRGILSLLFSFFFFSPHNCYAFRPSSELNASQAEGKTNYTRSPISQAGAFLRVPKRTKKNPTIPNINRARIPRNKQNRSEEEVEPN